MNSPANPSPGRGGDGDRNGKRIREMDALLGKYQDDVQLLARLAADGPAFFNPLEVAAAKGRRNLILRQWCRLNPDGTRLK